MGRECGGRALPCECDPAQRHAPSTSALSMARTLSRSWLVHL